MTTVTNLICMFIPCVMYDNKHAQGPTLLLNNHYIFIEYFTLLKVEGTVHSFDGSFINWLRSDF